MLDIFGGNGVLMSSYKIYTTDFTGELETIRNIDERLESYNLEVDLLSIYDKLKVE